MSFRDTFFDRASEGGFRDKWFDRLPVGGGAFGTSLSFGWTSTHLGSAYGVEIHPDGRPSVTTYNGQTVEILSADDGSTEQQFSDSYTEVFSWDEAGNLYAVNYYKDLKKWDPSGTVLYTKSAGGRFGMSCDISSALFANRYSSDGVEVFDLSGNLQWTAPATQRSPVVFDTSGNLIVANNGTGNNTTKYDPAGNVTWSKNPLEVHQDLAAAALPDDRVAIAGIQPGSTDENGSWGILDASGDLVTYVPHSDGFYHPLLPNVTYTDGIYHIAADKFGHIYVGYGLRPVDVARFAPDGTLVWSAYAQGLVTDNGYLYSDYCEGMAVTPEGSVILGFRDGTVKEILQE